jgi:hypothetical protein
VVELEDIGGLLQAVAAMGVFAAIYRWRPLTRRKQLAIAGIATLAFGMLFLVGMYAWVTRPHPTGIDVRAGERLAAVIREADSPHVREVQYREPTSLDPPQVDVWLRAGVTEDQAVALWCEVIAPAGGSPFEGDHGVAVWSAGGTEMMAVNPDC